MELQWRRISLVVSGFSRTRLKADTTDVRTEEALTQVTSDQMRGKLTFSIETGFRLACARNAGRSRSDLKPICTVKGAMARSRRASTAFSLRK